MTPETVKGAHRLTGKLGMILCICTGLLLGGCAAPAPRPEPSPAGPTEGSRGTETSFAATSASQEAPGHEVFSFDPIVWEDEGEGVSPFVWVAPNPLSQNTLIPSFAGTVTDPSAWPTVLRQTKVLKLYIQYLAMASKGELRRIADFVREQKLAVAVEVGGIRMASADTPDDEMGITASRDNELMMLYKFVSVGGRIDYITTDHALADLMTGRDKSRPEMTLQKLAEQQMLYFRYIREWFPQVKCGAIESLGYFWVNGDRQYQATDGALDRVDFETYLAEYTRIAAEYGVPIDHFHIDFGMHDVEYDGGYGRILAVEALCRAQGLQTGFVAANAFHYPNAAVTGDDVAKASASAAERTLRYFEGYMQAGGSADYLVLQRWQTYPIAVGGETEPLSNMGIFKAIIDSAYFPRKGE